MKAILVVDIPDFVNSVIYGVLKPIGTVGKLEIGYGSDDGNMTRFQCIDTDGALLKSVPRKMAVEHRWYSEDFARGYNLCIDEILGETE